jgi:hypothetical protein
LFYVTRTTFIEDLGIRLSVQMRKLTIKVDESDVRELESCLLNVISGFSLFQKFLEHSRIFVLRGWQPCRSDFLNEFIQRFFPRKVFSLCDAATSVVEVIRRSSFIDRTLLNMHCVIQTILVLIFSLSFNSGINNSK